MQGTQIAGRTTFTSTHSALGQSARVPLSMSRSLSNLAGMSVVLVCLALPLALGAIAGSTEEADADTYIQALHAAHASPPTAARVALYSTGIQAQPRLLDQHYYFLNGCVASPQDCRNDTAHNWGEYYAALRGLYEEAAKSAGCLQTQPFEEWAAGHAHFLLSQIAPAGAAAIARALAENTSSGDIHIIGTSAGGAAVFTYLSQSMRGELPLDGRIRSVITVDSPLGYPLSFQSGDTINGFLMGFQASAMKTDVQPGLGRWAEAANISVLTIDTRQDIVGHTALPDIANDPDPVYSQADTPTMSAYSICDSLPCRVEHFMEFLDLGSTWHIYTGSHMSGTAKQFIEEHWR